MPDAKPNDDVRAEIEAAARQATERAGYPSAYFERLHTEAERFALRTAPPDDIRAAVTLLEEQTNVDAAAPVESRNRGISSAKLVVRKAVFFAVNHLAEQVRAMGWAAVSVGHAAAERIEQLEARVRDLEARVATLEAKSEASPERGPSDDPSEEASPS